ncbi:recombinase family protein [Streptomyces sp. NPDC048484]|uniref:recombinase family protein n=1 Tax=Streptomyces sp. NPDC048484 TaxID=3155146 RepID=UPI003449AC7B
MPCPGFGVCLAADPVCGPIVSWIFTQRPARHSIARITRALNDAAIPCPSAAGSGHNPHPSRRQWVLTTVRAILANPRYTGRQLRKPPSAGAGSF